MWVWSVMFHYPGLSGDARIYAMQALARIYPPLRTDLYLQNTSQDEFTIFSPLYAFFIQRLGLETAALSLVIAFSIALLASSWNLARALSGRRSAWLGIASILILPSVYGGSGVFQYVEPILTARLPAEALAVAALACHFAARRKVGLLFAAASLVLHPLMAFPACLVLIGLRLRVQTCLFWSAAVLVSTGIAALIATHVPTSAHTFAIIDGEWLRVVRERSQFLFADLWSYHDWDVNLRALAALILAYLVIPDQRIRKLCLVSLLVGAMGLGVALLGAWIQPIAIIVQGQAWRWVWIAGLVGSLLMPLTAWYAWQDRGGGRLAVVLLVAAWCAPNGAAFAGLASLCWVMRSRSIPGLIRWLQWGTVMVAIAGVGWLGWRISAVIPTGRQGSGAAFLSALKLVAPALLGVASVLPSLQGWTIRGRIGSAAGLLLLSYLDTLLLPGSFEHKRIPTHVPELAAWIGAIPSTATVLVVPTRDFGEFVWFTLGRPNYLTVDQSAGVVFSRTTALEVERRSQVLLPIMTPDWEIRTRLAKHAEHPSELSPPIRLNAETLAEICSDPKLGFVISPESLGFGALSGIRKGNWKNWNLYECRRVRLETGRAADPLDDARES